MTVIVKLHGGLGNQMFQYAAARALAHRLGTEVRLDVTLVTDSRTRRYALDSFAIRAEAASADEMRAFHPRGRIQSAPLIATVRRALLGYGAYSIYRERHFHFDPLVSTLRGEVYLDGYWQSERYFADIEPQLRREFAFREPIGVDRAPLAARLAQSGSVSVHVRRGDYVTNPATNRLHGVVDPCFYRRAAHIIAGRVSEPSFFVFSDDPQWVRDNFDLHAPFEQVTPDMARPADDLRLMSLCAHHIIANSSFSWWGAWLADRRDNIVVAPGKWFAAGGHDTGDIIPDRWLTA